MRVVLFFLIFGFSQLRAQEFDLMMQAWYWDYFNQSNVGFGEWADHLSSKAQELSDAGFKHIWTPPLPRSSTSNNISNGYNPKDLYDFGETYGGGDCAWGNRAEYNAMVTTFTSHNLEVVSDVVYNHRDGGSPEKNSAVKTYISSSGTYTPYPSDRFFCIIPLGTNNPGNNGVGTYYIKVRSKAGQATNCQGSNKNPYGAYQYKFYAKTNTKNTYLGFINESEPNGGGDCNQQSQVCQLGQDVVCNLYEYGCCYTDEFALTLASGDFNAVDDTLFIYLNNTGGYSDHYIYSVWSGARSTNIINEVEYWTYTDFSSLPSGQGAMDYNNFRPHDGTASSESLAGDWNWMWFFYDYDQSVPSTQTVLNEWTKWQLSPNGASGAGIKGLRMDAVKHFDPAYVSQMLNYVVGQGTIPNMVVGEFFDTNAGTLKGWVDDVYAGLNGPAQSNVKVRAFDFSLRDALERSCDQFGYDARNVFNSGIVDGAGGSGFNAVTFINNHDFRSVGEYCTNNPELAYAYIMTNNQIGAPCIFYPDYYGVSPFTGVNPTSLKAQIDALSAIHQQYILGSTDIEYLSRFSTPYYQYFVTGQASTSLVYQIKPPGTSSQNVIVAINFSGTGLNMYQGVRTDWGITPGSIFQDIMGNSTTPTTSITSNNEIHVILPARSYTVFVQQTAPLPVELLDFTAKSEASARVRLEWKTAREEQFERFEVERSTGVADKFKLLSAIPGRFSAEGGVYQYYDEHPPLNVPLYYRLKMVDRDGTHQYSAIQVVTLRGAELRGSLSPNPSNGNARLQLQVDREQFVEIAVMDSNGRQVWTNQRLASGGQIFIEIPSKNWAQGVYQVLAKGEFGTEVFRLVKQ